MKPDKLPVPIQPGEFRHGSPIPEPVTVGTPTPELCNEQMCPVAGGGYLYCNAKNGHEGYHSHTFNTLFASGPLPSGAALGTREETPRDCTCPPNVRQDGATCDFCQSVHLSEAQTEVERLRKELAVAAEKIEALSEIGGKGKREIIRKYVAYRQFAEGQHCCLKVVREHEAAAERLLEELVATRQSNLENFNRAERSKASEKAMRAALELVRDSAFGKTTVQQLRTIAVAALTATQK